jgi:hypothetical protein
MVRCYLCDASVPMTQLSKHETQCEIGFALCWGLAGTVAIGAVLLATILWPAP